MEIKKSPKADLENKKSIFIPIGIVVALSFLFICLEWSQSEMKKKQNDFDATQNVETDLEIPSTVHQNTPPPPPPPAEVFIDKIVIVDNTEKVEMQKIDVPTVDDPLPTIPTVVSQPDDEEPQDVIFNASSVEKMPEFPGGTAALMKYLSKNIKYPEIALVNNIRGRVMVSFVVNQDGKIVDVSVLKGIHSSLDNEAVRVVSSMPPWSPGMQSGKPVRTRYTLPVMFKLQ